MLRKSRRRLTINFDADETEVNKTSVFWRFTKVTGYLDSGILNQSIETSLV
jgi:hypothetical protein